MVIGGSLFLVGDVTHDKDFSAKLLIFPHGTLIFHSQSARKIVKLNSLALKYGYVHNISRFIALCAIYDKKKQLLY